MPIKRSYYLSLAAVMCLIAFYFMSETGNAYDEKTAKTDITFTKDVAPIFFQNCLECHRPGEGAPFSALSFRDVRPWAKSIREKVLNRQMPPWHADSHGEFKNNRSLSQKEIDTIIAWVDGGAKEGDAKDLPPAPKYANGWNIGQPDMVVQVPEEYTYKAGVDEYQYFDIDPKFTEDKYVSNVEARPGNRKIVHHILAFIIPPGSPNMAKMTTDQRYKAMEMLLKNSPFYRDGYLLRVKPDQPVVDDACGSSSAARGGENQSILTGYAPGRNADVFEPGIARKIPAGSIIRFQIHYSNQTLGSDAVEKDRSMVGLIFAKEPPQKIVITNSIGNIFFKIPAGAENHRVTACRTLRRDTIIYGLMPHMHLRGKAMEYKVFYPDGKSETLINVPNYEFAWQTNYILKEPKRLPKGSKLMVTAYFDNSAKNRFNPDPSKEVRYGEPTYDEMMLGFMDSVAEAPAVAHVEAKILDKYTGKYEVSPNIFATVTRNGNSLIIQVPLQSKMEFLPQSETKFFMRGSDVDLTFILDDKGEVSEALLEGGRTTRVKRVKETAAARQVGQ